MNSVILLPNFHVWCQEVAKFSLKFSLSVKVSMKISRILDTTRENSARRSKSRYRYIENFDISAGDTIRTTYRYRIAIAIFSIHRSITSVCCYVVVVGQRAGSCSEVCLIAPRSGIAIVLFGRARFCSACVHTLANMGSWRSHICGVRFDMVLCVFS